MRKILVDITRNFAQVQFIVKSQKKAGIETCNTSSAMKIVENKRDKNALKRSNDDEV